MGMEHINKGAQMALQAFGITDQAKQRAMMEKLTGAQIGQIEAGQARQARMAPLEEQSTKLDIEAKQKALAMTPERELEMKKALAEFVAKLAGDKPVILPEGGTLVKGGTGEEIARGNPKEIKLSSKQELIRKTLLEELKREPTSGEIYKKEQADLETIAGMRMESLARTRGMAVVDPDDPNRVIPMTWKTISDLEKGGKSPSAAAYDPNTKTRVAEAQVPASARAASVRTASTVFDQEFPDLIRLRKIVQSKGLLPSGTMKDINAVNQWLGKRSSDPDVTELQKKTILLADSLQRTFGGAQGGEWAYNVAASILDPSYSPEAFERIIHSHATTLRRTATAYSNYGKEGDMDTPRNRAMSELIRRGKIVNEMTIDRAMKLMGGQ